MSDSFVNPDVEYLCLVHPHFKGDIPDRLKYKNVEIYRMPLFEYEMMKAFLGCYEDDKFWKVDDAFFVPKDGPLLGKAVLELKKNRGEE